MDISNFNPILTFMSGEWLENYQLWAWQLLYQCLLPALALNPFVTVEQFKDFNNMITAFKFRLQLYD